MSIKEQVRVQYSIHALYCTTASFYEGNTFPAANYPKLDDKNEIISTACEIVRS